MAKGLAHLRIEYYDDRPAEDVVVGQSDLVDAERYCRAHNVPQESVEATTYAAYRAALRMGLTDDRDFEHWRVGVASTIEAGSESGESAAPLG